MTSTQTPIEVVIGPGDLRHAAAELTRFVHETRSRYFPIDAAHPLYRLVVDDPVELLLEPSVAPLFNQAMSELDRPHTQMRLVLRWPPTALAARHPEDWWLRLDGLPERVCTALQWNCGVELDPPYTGPVHSHDG